MSKVMLSFFRRGRKDGEVGVPNRGIISWEARREV